MILIVQLIKEMVKGNLKDKTNVLNKKTTISIMIYCKCSLLNTLTDRVFCVQDCGMRRMVSSMTTSESMVRQLCL